jgi:hypothetical protein
MNSKIEFGKKVKCKITGFTGIVTGRAEYAYGTPRYMVEQQVGADGKPAEPVWFDESRLEVIE